MGFFSGSSQVTSARSLQKYERPFLPLAWATCFPSVVTTWGWWGCSFWSCFEASTEWSAEPVCLVWWPPQLSWWHADSPLPPCVLGSCWFVFGGLGVPAMGAEGCGWSTALVMLMELLAMVCVVLFSRIQQVGLFRQFSGPSLSKIGQLVRLGLPIGLSIFVEFGFFAVVTLLIGRLGSETVAAHQIINNISGLIFMVPLGLGMATSIRVGFNVGAGDRLAARRTGWIAMATSAGFALVSIVLLLALGPWLIELYTEQAPVIAIATSLLSIVACFLVFDGVQVNAMGALRGFKDTAVPFGIAFSCYWLVGFPIAWVLGFGYFENIDLGVHGYWLGLAAGLVFASAALGYRFHRVSRLEAPSP